jgi:predicted phosphoribosyltransferase
MLQNREHAAHLLAQQLEKYRDSNPIILAIPRGAVPMGKVMVEALDGEMDVVPVHKLGGADPATACECPGPEWY